MNAPTLRQLIRLMLEKIELLSEPDASSEGQEAQDEFSGVAAIGGGPAMPLGAGPHYPGPDLPAYSRTKKQVDIAGRSFGGARPARKKRRRKKK